MSITIAIPCLLHTKVLNKLHRNTNLTALQILQKRVVFSYANISIKFGVSFSYAWVSFYIVTGLMWTPTNWWESKSKNIKFSPPSTKERESVNQEIRRKSWRLQTPNLVPVIINTTVTSSDIYFSQVKMSYGGYVSRNYTFKCGINNDLNGIWTVTVWISLICLNVETFTSV